MPAVSVIIPTCDRPALLPRALASVLRQTSPDFEVLIVDSNRTAPPVESMRGCCEGLADPRVRVVARPHRANAAAARNVGLQSAQGEWVTYLDDDDEYTSTKIEQQLRRATAGPQPLVLCGAKVVLGGRTRRTQCEVDEMCGADLLNRARWATPLVFHRREAAVEFDETLSAGEDAHFAQALLAHWGLSSVPVIPEPLVVMHQEGVPRARTNLLADANWRAARGILSQFGVRYPAEARRVYLLRALITREKLRHRPARCFGYGIGLLRVAGAGQLRFLANALVFASGLARGRVVT